MTFVVPFDGSTLSEAALARAASFGDCKDRDVVAVTVVPRGNAAYARDHGWLPDDAAFDGDRIRRRLRRQVRGVAPDAEFQYVAVDRHAPPGQIATAVRRQARRLGATMVFVGSEHAGHMVNSISSVGSGITAEDAYDVVVVRHDHEA